MKTLVVWIAFCLPLLAEKASTPKMDQPMKVQVDREGLPEAHKDIPNKIGFDARVISLRQLLDKKSDPKPSPTFLMISAEANENLGARLLWCDVEVELSDGRKLKIERFPFHLLSTGIEGDVRKLDDSDSMLEFKSPGEGEKKALRKLVEVKKLKISNMQFK